MRSPAIFTEAVDAAFIRNALEVLCVLEHLADVRKALQILKQIIVMGLENLLFEPFNRVCGKLNAFFL